MVIEYFNFSYALISTHFECLRPTEVSLTLAYHFCSCKIPSSVSLEIQEIQHLSCEVLM